MRLQGQRTPQIRGCLMGNRAAFLETSSSEKGIKEHPTQRVWAPRPHSRTSLGSGQGQRSIFISGAATHTTHTQHLYELRLKTAPNLVALPSSSFSVSGICKQLSRVVLARGLSGAAAAGRPLSHGPLSGPPECPQATAADFAQRDRSQRASG